MSQSRDKLKAKSSGDISFHRHKVRKVNRQLWSCDHPQQTAAGSQCSPSLLLQPLTLCVQQPKPTPEPQLNPAQSGTVPPKTTQLLHQPLGSTAPSPGALSCLFSLDKHLHKTQDLALKDTDEPFQLTHGKTAQCAVSHSQNEIWYLSSRRKD